MDLYYFLKISVLVVPSLQIEVASKPLSYDGRENALCLKI